MKSPSDNELLRTFESEDPEFDSVTYEDTACDLEDEDIITEVGEVNTVIVVVPSIGEINKLVIYTDFQTGSLKMEPSDQKLQKTPLKIWRCALDLTDYILEYER